MNKDSSQFSIKVKEQANMLFDSKILVNDLTSLFQSRAGQILNDNNGVIKFTIQLNFHSLASVKILSGFCKRFSSLDKTFSYK